VRRLDWLRWWLIHEVGQLTLGILDIVLDPARTAFRAAAPPAFVAGLPGPACSRYRARPRFRRAEAQQILERETPHVDIAFDRPPTARRSFDPPLMDSWEARLTVWSNGALRPSMVFL